MHSNGRAPPGNQSYGFSDPTASDKRPSGFDSDVYYPSFPTQHQQLSTAPLLGDRGGDLHAHTQRQYATHPPPLPVYQHPLPPESNGYHARSWVNLLLRFMAFHVLNALLGFVGFIMAIVGGSLSIGLVPLCCIGVVLFRVLFFLVGVLATLDVKLHNFVTPSSERIYLRTPQEAGVTGVVLAPRLGSMSRESVLALLYFVSIKFVFAILSIVVVVLTASPLVIIGALLMEIVARISNKLVKKFCCESFSTAAPLLSYQQQQTSQSFIKPSSISYGSTA